MTTKYEPVKIWVDKKSWNKLKIKLLKPTKQHPQGQSLSSWVREKTKEFLSEKQ